MNAVTFNRKVTTLLSAHLEIFDDSAVLQVPEVKLFSQMQLASAVCTRGTRR
jgi:hypothetical protein